MDNSAWIAVAIAAVAVAVIVVTQNNNRTVREALKTAVESMAFVRAELAESRERIAVLNQKIAESEEISFVAIGFIRTLMAALSQYDIEAPEMPPELRNFQQRFTSTRRGDTLTGLLANHFNAEELEQMIYDLGIDGGSIGGDSLLGRCQQLVAYLNRHQLRVQALELLAELRPQVEWPRE